MLFLRSCFDKPDMGDKRNEFRAEHRAYLKPFTGESGALRLLSAGPMCVSDTDDTNIGSFMIVEAASREDVQTFHDNDPFSLREIFGRVEIVRWDRHIG